MKRGVLLVLLLAGCSRDLELPEAPAPEEAKPRFLGRFAGLHQLSLPLEALGFTDEPSPFDVPAGTKAVVMHIGNPSPEDPLEPVVVLSSLPALAQRKPDGLPADACGGRVVASSPTTQAFYGHYDRDTGALALVDRDSGAEVPGASVAGASSFRVEIPLCGGRTSMRLGSSRACPFDTAVSGVYEGRYDEDDGGEASLLGLGFAGPLVVAMEWPTAPIEAFPATSRFGVGVYDRYDEAGRLVGASFDEAGDGAPIFADLSVTEADGQLVARLVAARGESYDASKLAGPNVLGFTGTRDAGVDTAACDAGSPLEVALAWELRECDDRTRVLDTRVITSTGVVLVPATAILGGTLVQVNIERAGGGQAPRTEEAPGAWPPVTARFRLPAGDDAYGLLGVVVAPSAVAATLPACVPVSR